MNSINPQSLKKLLISLALSILIIIVFLILQVFLQEDKDVELKSFKDSSTLEVQNIQEEIQKEVEGKKEKILILPAK